METRAPTCRVSAAPVPNRILTPRLFDPRIVLIEDKDLGYEVDLTADWKMNDHVLWSFVVATMFPGNGLEQATGGNSVWTHAMIYASMSF